MIDTLIVGDTCAASFDLVLLHGFSMEPQDLEPFARSLGLAARFILPEAPIILPTGGRAWWPLDPEQHQPIAEDRHAVRRERAKAVSAVSELLESLDAVGIARPIALAGFSQGGILACELVLQGSCRPDVLILLSTTQDELADWNSGREAFAGLPILQSHGLRDPDLVFSEGERLHAWLHDAGAVLTWVPFEGGHEIPFPVWREIKRFLRGTVCPRVHGTNPSNC